MARELAFTFINPYIISKSRTGGVIARYMSRTGLDLVGARMFGPSRQLADNYADMVEEENFYPAPMRRLIADYIRRNYSPDPETGLRRRVMMLLFEGDEAVAKMRMVAGNPMNSWGRGDTIRGTYGDYIVGEDGKVQYFEPAVLLGPDLEKTGMILRLWAKYSAADGGMVESAVDIPRGVGAQTTLVMLKPDNFRFPSLRAGHIMDVLSRSGLRIIAMKKFSMTVAQAEEFYGPVRPVLRAKLGPRLGEKACEILTRELGFALPPKLVASVTRTVGVAAADNQFERIVQFMTGFAPSEVKESEKKSAGKESCIALVYRGLDAVRVIRDILGPTDPSKAPAGSVRREFGSDIMVNAAHASDSPRNAQREIRILNVAGDDIRAWVKTYYGV